MAAVKELLRAEADGALGFGDYTLSSKTKLDGFEFQGDVYKVKTFSEITKLEKNGMFVYESVPGTAVEDFKASEREVSFKVSGTEDAPDYTGAGSRQRICCVYGRCECRRYDNEFKRKTERERRT